mgnify:CR=1 FL=1
MSELSEDQAFRQGATDRRRGVSKSQSAKAYGTASSPDEWKACRMGWDAMDTYLMMGEIDKQVTAEEG